MPCPRRMLVLGRTAPCISAPQLPYLKDEKLRLEYGRSCIERRARAGDTGRQTARHGRLHRKQVGMPGLSEIGPVVDIWRSRDIEVAVT